MTTEKVIEVGGQWRDLLTLECRHVISIEPTDTIPVEHECWQCVMVKKRAAV